MRAEHGAAPTGSCDVAVIGAGAAGLMAAISAARAGAEVVLLEGTPDGGRKILISGGGRCNILPSVARPDRFVTDSSRNSLRKILRAWPLAEQRAFFEAELGMVLELEPETGKLFPASHRARDVRDGLVRTVREAGVLMWFGAKVLGLRREGPSWKLDVEGARSLAASRVVVATGGLSVQATGSDGAGLRWARELGHEIRLPYPALTPLLAHPHPHPHLAGVSTVARVEARGAGGAFDTTDGLLVTHRGWSGPAILDVSHVATLAADPDQGEIRVSWDSASPEEWDSSLRGGAGSVRSVATSRLPRRLVDALLAQVGVDPGTPLARLRREDRMAVVEVFSHYRLPWTGDEGYRKAEVTGGGVALGEVDARTMESRRVPGLHFCGEILDAFGPIGGHNFMWAWTTGRAAGRGAAAMARTE